jgi:hypothetical protein
METEIQGSSPSNSIDHIDMDNLGSDSDEEYIDGISHTEGISYTDGISHIDEISYSHMTPPRIKRTDYPT